MTVVVERVQVEEGFLDGLDLKLVPGLNVLIGARGVGKTSVVELIRYCLGVKSTSEDIDERALEHALSVLRTGKVTVTLRSGDRETIVARSAGDDEPRATGRFSVPDIFSQTEIEHVGLEARGRLRILDRLADNTNPKGKEERAIDALVRSLTIQIRQTNEEREAVQEQVAALTAVPQELEEALNSQKSILRTVTESQRLQKKVKDLGASVAQGSVQVRLFESALSDLVSWGTRITSIVENRPRIAQWPSSAGPSDQLKDTRAAVAELEAGIVELTADLQGSVEALSQKRNKVQKDLMDAEDQARKLRKQLDQIREGAGAAANRVNALQEKVGHLEALKSRERDLAERGSELRSERDVQLLALRRLRDARFSNRGRVAQQLTELLGPAIEVIVEQGGAGPAYIAAIQAAIRGSGLHHSSLAPQLARAMSPEELAKAIEESDSETIARLAAVPEDRAQKIIAVMARAGIEDVISAPIDDDVTMRLLDGVEYKTTSNLSTGQRCTVILSVLLAGGSRGLVIDQPEDNLDNAFIVSTLLEAIKQRKQTAQLLFATHNANIPVLGGADHVACLDSDGKHGFVKCSGPLERSDIVNAITSVMEGGREAFELRAQFYKRFRKQGPP